MTKHLRVIICIVLFLFMLSGSVFAVDWGCCVDLSLGCHNVYEEDDINSCIAADYQYVQGKSCYDIPGKTVDIVDNGLCFQGGCCCLGDSFQENLNDAQCSLLNGIFSTNTDCSEACDIEYVPEVNTCDSIGGFWCNVSQANVSANLLDSNLDEFTGRPSPAFSCYDLPCVSDEGNTCTDRGFAELCTNGRDDDGDCKIDTVDEDCSYSIGGTVVSSTGLPVSNVKIRFTNKDHINNPVAFDNYIDSFTTYSVGSEGEFFFSGLSLNNFEVEVVDNFYKSKVGSQPFQLTTLDPFIDDFLIEVVPRNSFSVKGVITSDGQPIRDALVSLEGTSLFASTNDDGEYEINHIVINNPNFYYNVIAFKSDYLPGEQSVKTGTSGEVKEVNLDLSSNLCSIKPSVPHIDTLKNVKGETSLYLNFTSGGCKADSYMLYRCEGSSCASESDGFTPVATIPGNLNEFTDTSSELRWGQDYTYFIKLESSGSYSLASNFVSLNTGRQECAGKQDVGLFCDYQTDNGANVDRIKTVISSRGVYCDAFNQLQETEVCPAGFQCAENDPGTSHSTISCRMKDSCLPEDSNYFGLYFTEESCEGENNENFCVYDYSRTNTDYCYSCEKYSSCFSYKSERSCGENVCNVGNCEWSVTNEVLNTGVCYDSSKSECDDCNDPFNKLFGLCDQETCSELGDCAFSVQDSTCQDCDEISCYDYGDANSCVGGVYNRYLNPLTNLFREGSNDACEVKSCAWNSIDNYCYKDSDVDGVEDCLWLKGKAMPSLIGRETYTQNTCLKDSIAPITSVSFNTRSFNPFEPINGELVATFDSVDRASSSAAEYDSQAIYYCIEPAGSNYCKTKRSGEGFGTFEEITQANSDGKSIIKLAGANSQMKISPNGLKEFPISVGKNLLKFFSVDYANNLEQIRVEEFHIDRDAPVIDVSIVRKPDFQKKTTDVEVFVSSNELVYCSVNFADCGAMGNCDPLTFDTESINTSFINANRPNFKTLYSRDFSGIGDGQNSINVVCTDLSGNIFESTDNFLLDVDPRIKSPLPAGVTDQVDVDISVETISQVECKYTKDLFLDYERIPAYNTLSISKKGSTYLHRKTVRVVESGQQTFYVKCDYSPRAVEKISYTLDKLKPTVKAVLPNGINLDKLGWLSDASILLECNDEPVGGFGCNSTLYCLNPVPNANRIELVANCIPNVPYNGKLDLTQPSSICFNANENSVDGEGGLRSNTECVNAFIDLEDPQLVLDYLPSSINSNLLSLSGKVYDSYKFDSVSFEQNSDHESFFTGSSAHTSFISDISTVNKFDYLTSIDFTSLGQLALTDEDVMDGKVYLLFQYKSSTNFGAVVFDIKKGTLSIGVKNGIMGFKEVETIDLPEDYFTGYKEIRLTRDSAGLRVFVKDEFSRHDLVLESKNQIFKKLFNGEFGVLLVDSSKGDAFSNTLKSAFGELKLYFPGEEPFKSLDKRVEFSINKKLKEIIKTSEDFEVSSTLTEGVPRHGNSYTVSIFAEDLAGRKSEVADKKVVYDLSGPVVSAVSFDSTAEQSTYDYVEYANDAKLLVDVKDDFSKVSEVIVRIRDIESKLSFDVSANKFSTIFETSKLPAGSHDVIIESYDGLGNKNVELFENSLLIEDRIDPAIVLDFDNNYFNVATPEIKFSTDEPAKCSVSYLNRGGVESQVSSSIGFSKTHVIKTTSPLNHSEGSEIENELTLVCSDENENKISLLVDIVIDLRDPLYTISLDTSDLIEVKKQRHYWELTSLRAADKSFYSFADEPVKCKFSQGSLMDFEGMEDFIVSYKYQDSDRSKSVLVNPGARESFFFICEDRAGNQGVVKQINLGVDPNVVPYMFGLDDEFNLNVQTQLAEVSDVLSYDTIRNDVSCSYTLQGEREDVTQVVGSSIFVDNQIDLSSLSEGTHDLKVDCYRGADTTVKHVVVNKDFSLPNLSVDDIKLSSSGFVSTDSSKYPLTISSLDDGTLRIINNGVLVYESFGKVFDLELILEYGNNNLEVEFTDFAKNVVLEEYVILSTFEKEKSLFSNYLGGSFRSDYTGKYLSRLQTPDAELIISLDGKTISKALTGSFNSDTKWSEFTIDVSNEELFALISPLNLSEVYLQSYPDYYLVSVKVIQGTLEREELFYYSPFSEDIRVDVPNKNVITEADLDNSYILKGRGSFVQENYAIDSEFIFAEKTDLSSLSDLNVSLSNFMFSQDLISGLYKFDIDSKNDLGIRFGIFSTVLFDSIGPQPEISLYPSGAISYSSRPQFNVVFEGPSKILSAKVLDSNLSEEFAVSGFSDELIFSIRLAQSDSLTEEGVYYLEIVAEDGNGNVDDSQFEFSYSKAPFTLELIDPASGYSAKPTFEITLQSDRIASCAYSFDSGSFDSKDEISSLSVDHQFEATLEENDYKSLYVQCEEFEGSISDEFEFKIGVDSTAPVFNSLKIVNAEMISGMPYLVQYPLAAQLEVSLDEDSFCKYELVNRGESRVESFENMTSLFCSGVKCYSSNISASVGNLKDDSSYDLYLSCENRAGLVSSDKTEFQVDLSQGDKIVIILPENYANNPTVPISVKTSLPTTNCTYGFNSDQIKNTFSKHSADNLYHNASRRLSEGRYNLKVACTMDGGTFYKNQSFIIDSSKPKRGTIVAAENTPSLERLTARAINFTDEESGIKLYEFSIGIAPYGKVGWNSVMNWTQSQRESLIAQRLNLTKGVDYYWSVRALNYVNLYSDVASSLGTEAGVIQRQFENGSVDTCSDGKLNNKERAIDCGIACLTPCNVGDTCFTDDDCYKDGLRCSDNFVCETDIADLGDDPYVNDTTYLDVNETEIVISHDDTSTTLTEKSNGWLFWLIALLMLVGLSGGGYYAYVTYVKRDDSDDVVGPQASIAGDLKKESATTSTEDSAANAEEAKKAAEVAKKKEELKLALKKKLVDEEKKDKSEARDKMFGEFSGESGMDDKVSGGSVKSDETRDREKAARDASKRVAKLKQEMNKHKEISSGFSSHPAGDAVSSPKVRSMHSDLVKSTKDHELNSNKFENRRVSEKSKRVRSALKAFDSEPTKSEKTTTKKKTAGAKK